MGGSDWDVTLQKVQDSRPGPIIALFLKIRNFTPHCLSTEVSKVDTSDIMLQKSGQGSKLRNLEVLF